MGRKHIRRGCHLDPIELIRKHRSFYVTFTGHVESESRNSSGSKNPKCENRRDFMMYSSKQLDDFYGVSLQLIPLWDFRIPETTHIGRFGSTVYILKSV